MVTVEREATGGPDPEVHMDDWVYTQTLEVTLERLGSFPQSTSVAPTVPTTRAVESKSHGSGQYRLQCANEEGHTQVTNENP
jgi:hypothetical protein